ncbi:MAG: hypothetical protein H6643_01805 [Caldilineaceae bacterium]|nr:hypothetical protein [Caldilineaceae bacterium]
MAGTHRGRLRQRDQAPPLDNIISMFIQAMDLVLVVLACLAPSCCCGRSAWATCWRVGGDWAKSSPWHMSR